MTHATLLSSAQLAAHIDDPGWVVFDCRHDLARPEAGEQDYLRGHIPGARFLHLDRDLAGPTSGKNGRHPLPSSGEFAACMTRAGVRDSTQVAAYDAQGGMYAARLWWLLRWLGHDAVAVLDGGWQRWTSEQRPVTSEPPPPGAGDFTARVRALSIPVADLRSERERLELIDARAPDRFRGENETLDPVGGRIPGARNRFFRDNLDADGRFKAPGTLRSEWNAALAGSAPSATVHYCGSGVSACHNLLAMEIAGMPGSRLYPGSWSEWCADPARPVERGEPGVSSGA